MIQPQFVRIAMPGGDAVKHALTRSAGWFRSISIARASRLKSSTTLNVRKQI
jgi:hypothetical protein